MNRFLPRPHLCLLLRCICVVLLLVATSGWYRDDHIVCRTILYDDVWIIRKGTTRSDKTNTNIAATDIDEDEEENDNQLTMNGITSSFFLSVSDYIWKWELKACTRTLSKTVQCAHNRDRDQGAFLSWPSCHDHDHDYVWQKNKHTLFSFWKTR